MSVLILVSNGAIQRSNRVCSQESANIRPKPRKISQNHQKSTCWNLGMSVLSWVSNGAFQRSNRICSQDQHAQAQHWLRQAQLMHAQHWPRTQSCSRQGGLPPLASFAFGSKNNAEPAWAEPEHAWANVEPEHADLGYISCCCVERHHSKPNSKLSSLNFNMLTFGDLGWFGSDFD